MTGSSMANGCDVTESDVTGIDATGIRRPKVGDSPVYFDLFEVCCTPRVFSITSAFSLWYFY
jgi:hypothetical protein